MTSKEIVKKIICEWGFPILEEVDEAIATRFQMNYVNINTLKEDSKGIAVTLSGIFRAADEQELRLALKTCNELNYSLMQAKLYIDNDNDLIIACEFFYITQEDVADLLRLALHGVIIAKKQFLLKYDEIKDADRLWNEINHIN